MVLQIHDELLFKVDKDELETVYQIVKDTMEHAMDFTVKLEVDGSAAHTWYDAK